MDHWRSLSPHGPIDQWESRNSMDRFLKQVAAVGYDAIDTFGFRWYQIIGEYG
jgi:inosose dehydratase